MGSAVSKPCETLGDCVVKYLRPRRTFIWVFFPPPDLTLMFDLEHYLINSPAPQSWKILLSLNMCHTVPKSYSDIKLKKSQIFNNICKVFWFGEQMNQRDMNFSTQRHRGPKISAIEHLTTRESYMNSITATYDS